MFAESVYNWNFDGVELKRWIRVFDDVQHLKLFFQKARTDLHSAKMQEGDAEAKKIVNIDMISSLI